MGDRLIFLAESQWPETNGWDALVFIAMLAAACFIVWALTR